MNDDNDINTNTNVGAALAFAARTTKPDVILVDGHGLTNEQIIVTRTAEGGTALTPARSLLAPYLPAPQQRRGTIETHSVGSFVNLVNRDKRPDSVIFADVNGRKLTAVLDFHGPADSAPRFGQDRVTYGFAFSASFLAWFKAASAPMDQKTFARFIDDRLSDLGDGGSVGEVAAEYARRRGIRFPSITDVLVFTRSIAGRTTTDSEEVYDDATGNVSIQFKKRNDLKSADGSPVTPPVALLLDIPILNGPGASRFTIAVRVKFDVEAKSGVTWRLEMHAPETYIQAAIEEAVAAVSQPAPEGCGLPVYLATAPA